MPEDDVKTTGKEGGKLQTPRKSSSSSEDRMATISSSLLDRGDSIVYIFVGACFFLGALFALGYGLWSFGSMCLLNAYSIYFPGALDRRTG